MLFGFIFLLYLNILLMFKLIFHDMLSNYDIISILLLIPNFIFIIHYILCFNINILL